MTANGIFQYTNARGPTNFTGLNGYQQPDLVALDPEDEDIFVAGGADSGIFVNLNGGTSWTVVSDPLSSYDTDKPHIPRPQFAYFDHEPRSVSDDLFNIYIGTKGRGIWRLRVGP